MRKLELFNRLMRPTKDAKVLDLGAEADPKNEKQVQLIDAYLWKENVTAGNISAECLFVIKESYPEIETVVVDACNLPWSDKYFDIVYSGAVIEHVGDFEKQNKMASEIMRVGKRWFVTTPNRWYPYEFHMRLPLVTWLPGDGYLRAGRIISYNHVKHKYSFGNKCDFLRLMTAKELHICFPDSKVIKQRVTFMAESLIVVGGDVQPM